VACSIVTCDITTRCLDKIWPAEGKAIHRKPHQQVVPARVVTGASKEKKDRDNVSDGTVSSKRQKWIGPKEHPEARAYAQ